MIVDYVVPKTSIYNLRIPDGMINSEIEIIIKKSNRNNTKSEIDFNIVRLALQNLKVKKIKIADNLITATAQINNLTLVTRNVIDFKGVVLAEME